jgi:hypothetical protein
LVCTDDTEAIEKANRPVNGHDVELWQRDRMVASLKPFQIELLKKNEPSRRSLDLLERERRDE